MSKLSKKLKKLEKPKSLWQKVKDKWASFEAWVYTWLPGFKTRLTSAVGAIGMAAATMQQYVTGLPATKWISQEVLTGVAAVMFTLSFWFSNMGKRVEEAKE